MTEPATTEHEVETTVVRFTIDQKTVTTTEIEARVPSHVARKGNAAVKRWLQRNSWGDEYEDRGVVHSEYGAYIASTIDVTYNKANPTEGS